MRFTIKAICVGALALGALLPRTALAADPFPPSALPGTEIGGSLPNSYEPSGAVWHPLLEKLFTVSDDGFVSTLDDDGANFNTLTLSAVPTGVTDFEGITIADPNSPFVYVGVERPDSILELNRITGAVTRSFDLTPFMTGPDNRGLEALTFVPDSQNPEGGIFYAGLQNDGQVYSFQLPILSSASSTTVTHVNTFTPVVGRDDLSGLHYDTVEQVLYAVFDSSNLLTALEKDGTFLAEWNLVGNDQEGVALDGSRLFIAEDGDDQIWRYDEFPILSTLPAADFDRDSDVDGDDLDNWQAGYGTTTAATKSQGDANGDSRVDGLDLLVWQAQYGTGLPEPLTATTVVPEPSSLLLMGIAAGLGISLLRNSRSRQ